VSTRQRPEDPDETAAWERDKWAHPRQRDEDDATTEDWEEHKKKGGDNRTDRER
jgi:hypothetical protein